MGGTVEIFEVGPRDGLQNEKRAIPVADKIALVDCLSGAGFRRIEVASFVSPKWVPQMADNHAVMAGLVRQSGLAMDSESADPQLQVIVTPVHDDLGGVVASLALNVSHLSSVPPEWQDALKASAQRVSALLGWQHAASA